VDGALGVGAAPEPSKGGFCPWRSSPHTVHLSGLPSAERHAAPPHRIRAPGSPPLDKILTAESGRQACLYGRITYVGSLLPQHRHTECFRPVSIGTQLVHEFGPPLSSNRTTVSTGVWWRSQSTYILHLPTDVISHTSRIPLPEGDRTGLGKYFSPITSGLGRGSTSSSLTIEEGPPIFRSP
jgi:hypothetical protein